MNKFSVNKFNYTDVYRALLKLDGNESRIVSEEEYVFCAFIQILLTIIKHKNNSEIQIDCYQEK